MNWCRIDTLFKLTMMNTLLSYPAPWSGKMYSLVFVDPDIPASRPSVGTNDRPLLHGLTVNINGSDVTTGSVLQTYLGPGPPDRRHYYYFLLYEQKGVLQVNKSSEYTNCTGRLVDR